MVDGSCIIVVDLSVSGAVEGASGLANLQQCFFLFSGKPGNRLKLIFYEYAAAFQDQCSVVSMYAYQETEE